LDPVDDILIEKTLAGSLECFDVLMQRYQRDVFAVARGYARSGEDARDICQNAFLKAYSKLHTFGGRSSFRTWLAAIANREGLNWVRSQSRKAPAAVADNEIEAIPSSEDHEARVLAVERRHLVVRKLGVLNQRSRLAVVLRYFRDMPICEVAKVLDCSEGVVRNMLFRSVRKLRDAVATE
jgi:RNA polymerase sigma-70 factor (ECF subfamily)